MYIFNINKYLFQIVHTRIAQVHYSYEEEEEQVEKSKKHLRVTRCLLILLLIERS